MSFGPDLDEWGKPNLRHNVVRKWATLYVPNVDGDREIPE